MHLKRWNCIALAAFALASPALAQDGARHEGKCHDKKAWFANAEADGASAVLLPCGEEEPAAVLALYCKRADQSVQMQVEAGPGFNENESYTTIVSVDGEPFKYSARWNPDGMYERFEFASGADDPLLEALQAGNEAGVAIQGNAVEFSLRGSRAAIGFMLRHCVK